MRALVVEDDETMALLIRHILEEEGFAADHARTAEEGETLAFVHDYDAVVLDLGLPDRSGMTVLQSLRRKGNDTPVLVLTARGDKETTVRALDAGADDYVRKPLAVEEFKARVRALIRRGGARRTELLSCGNLLLNRLTRDATVDGRSLSLTPKELGLLEYLLLHAGQVVTRTTLLEKVWDMNFDPISNVVDVNVARLRKKLAASGATAGIVARRGMGFVLGTVSLGSTGVAAA